MVFDPAQSYLQGTAIGRENKLASLVNNISQKMGDSLFDPSSSMEFEQLAVLDPQRASLIRSNFEKLSDDRKRKYFEYARDSLDTLENKGLEDFLELSSKRLDYVESVNGDTSGIKMLINKALQGDFAELSSGLMRTVEAGIASGFLPKPGEREKPEIGRYKSQVVGNTLVITDSATGQVVQEITKDTSEKEKLELKKLEAQVNKAETEAELKALTAQTEEDKKQASLDMATQAADLAEKILGNPALSNITGTFDAMTPVVMPESQDVLNDAKRLESLLTVDNLKLMSGVLTDKDISFLTRVGSGLNITDTGIKGSEKAVKARLNDIVAKLRGVTPKKNTVGRFTVEVE